MQSVSDQSGLPNVQTDAPVYGSPAQNGQPDLVVILDQLNQVSAIRDLDELVGKCLDLLIQASVGDAAIFYLFDHDTDDFILTAVRGAIEINNLTGLRLKKNQGLIGEAILCEDPVICGELLSDPQWLRAIYPPKADSLNASLIFPLLFERELIGAVQLVNYTIADIRLLRVLAARMVTEIERIILLFLERRANHRLNNLLEILRETGNTLDRSLLFQLVTERVTRLLDAERGSIFLVDASNRDIGLNVSYQSPQPVYDGLADYQSTGPTSAILYEVLSRRWKCSAYRSQTARNDNFGFTTRSAITVPLRTASHDKASEGNRRIIGGLMALNKHSGAAFDEEDVYLLEILADHTSSILQITEISENANELYLDVIKALVASLDAKDPYTQGHSLRVMDFAVALARELKLGSDMIADIRIASLLHDVGKIGISDQILRKTDGLSAAEYEIMKKHPIIGGNIMKQVHVLGSIIPGIVEHHERLDGSGYPLGLIGNNISLMGRIISIADVYDAMTSDRPYRPALPPQSVLRYLQSNAGILFDPDGVRAFTQVSERYSGG